MNLKAAQTYAHEQMAAHGLIAQGWTFDFDRSRVRFGLCSYTKKLISLSCYLTDMNSEADVKDTILHEIAHAIVGHVHGHDFVWRTLAISLGCNGHRCYDNKMVVQPPEKWIGTCPTCRREVRRHNRRQISCSHCSATFNPKHLFVWTRA